MAIAAAIIGGVSAATGVASTVVQANQAGQAREDMAAATKKQEDAQAKAEADLKKKKEQDINAKAMAGGAARLRAQSRAGGGIPSPLSGGPLGGGPGSGGSNVKTILGG